MKSRPGSFERIWSFRKYRFIRKAQYFVRDSTWNEVSTHWEIFIFLLQNWFEMGTMEFCTHIFVRKRKKMFCIKQKRKKNSLAYYTHCWRKKRPSQIKKLRSFRQMNYLQLFLHLSVSSILWKITHWVCIWYVFSWGLSDSEVSTDLGSLIGNFDGEHSTNWKSSNCPATLILHEINFDWFQKFKIHPSIMFGILIFREFQTWKCHKFPKIFKLVNSGQNGKNGLFQNF